MQIGSLKWLYIIVCKKTRFFSDFTQNIWGVFNNLAPLYVNLFAVNVFVKNEIDLSS